MFTCQIRSIGGAGFVDLKDFCIITLLAQLKAWFTSAPLYLWKETESTQVLGKDLYYWPISDTKVKVKDKLFSPTLAASISVSATTSPSFQALLHTSKII